MSVTSKTIHGVLMKIFGLGVLFLGESGIGKSECALDLIGRGHQLVADDAILLNFDGKMVVGQAPELTFELLEIHGLGIINIRELFGQSAICQRIEISFCIDFKRWAKCNFDNRFGLEKLENTVAGVTLPTFEIPVSAGRNLPTLAETATRMFLLRRESSGNAVSLIEKHRQLLQDG